MRVWKQELHFKNSAPIGPDVSSSAGAGVWTKAPGAYPDSSPLLDQFLSAIIRPRCVRAYWAQTPRTSPSNPPRPPLLRGRFGIDSALIRHWFDIDVLIWPYFDAKSSPEEGRARRIRAWGPGGLCLTNPHKAKPPQRAGLPPKELEVSPTNPRYFVENEPCDGARATRAEIPEKKVAQK